MDINSMISTGNNTSSTTTLTNVNLNDINTHNITTSIGLTDSQNGYFNSIFLSSDDGSYNDNESNLSNLDYIIKFSYDINSHLKNNIKSIKNKTIIFNCDYDDKSRIQPYELIMTMIYEKRKFDIFIDIDDILTVKYLGVRFKSIQNNFTFNNDKCNFDALRVKMKCEGVIYDNKNLDITEKRKEKLNKIEEI